MSAHPVISLQGIPTWVLCLAWVIAIGGMLGVIARIFPRPELKSQLRRMSLLFAVLVIWVVSQRFSREIIWLGVVIGFSVLPGLLWYGRLPDDFPPVGDPSRRQYPGYSRIEKHGRRAGYLLVVGLLAGLVLSFVFIRVA